MLHEETDQKDQEQPDAKSVKADTESVEEAAANSVQDPRDVLILQLAEERDSLKDEMIRALAEAQNIQRRLREQHADALKFASEPLVQELLPVLDNFERTIKAFEGGATAEQIIKGVQQVEKQLRQALNKVNVERIDSVGKKFDPEIHEALTTVVSDELDEDTVTSEIDAGYMMQGRVIRPARVQVSKKP